MMKNVTNSRSYSGLNTYTDHRLVVTTINIKVGQSSMSEKKPPQIDFMRLKDDTTVREQYNLRVQEEMQKSECPSDIQARWDKITRIQKKVAQEVIGPKPRKSQRIQDPEIENLSARQQKLRNDINCSSDKARRTELRQERNRIMNTIHLRKNEIDMRDITDKIAEIEKNKDHSTRMFAAVRLLQNYKPKEPLLLDKKDGGKTSNDEEHAEIITEYFKELFQVIDAAPFPDIPPMPMRKKFNTDEVKKAIKKLKNNKAAGIDEVKAEQLKYGPDIIASEIADILNECAATGKHPKEIKLGVMSALQKPGKPAGPCKSLRPIVLLSMLRKILAIIMIDRVGEKIKEKIPPSQAAYSKGRSTTEHVMAFKLLAEKAVTSADYECFILMKDMSRAFDTVNRKTLMDDLQAVLDPDELHIAKLLLEDVALIVRCGSSHGTEFKTNIGTPQGDCLSPILFTLYLANALKDETPQNPEGGTPHSREYPPGSSTQHRHMKNTHTQE